jgi:16S rRNA processing protein RimM
MPSAPMERLEIGRIGRPHGVRGDVMVTLTTTRLERVAVGAKWWLGSSDDAAAKTPKAVREVVVEAARPHQGRYIVHLSGLEDRDEAAALTGTRVFAEALPDDPASDDVYVHQVIGAEVVDRSGRSYGPVVAVEANPAHDLLVLEGGGLVPMVFVVEQVAGRVLIDPPDGLVD